MKKILSVILALALCMVCFCASAEGDEWLCPDCGATNTTNFCIKCGAKRPEVIVCPDCGEKYAIDSGAVFCGNCGAKLRQYVTAPIRYEGEGFDSPEDAVTCYLEGLKNLNFEQMLGAFAWETQMEHYSFDAYYGRIRAYSPAAMPRMPSVNGFMFSANVNALRSYQVRMIYASIENYILGDEAPQGKMIQLKEQEDIDAFLHKFENGKLDNLAGMANIRFLTPDDITGGKFSYEVNQQGFAKQSAYYGADEVVNIVGAADIGDETLYCCPTAARYGDKWYLVSVGSYVSSIAGIPVDYQAFFCGEGKLEDLTNELFR